jgi:ethanolamine ammonia-lyase small subunit
VDAVAAHIGAGVVMLCFGRRPGLAIAAVTLAVATSLAALVAYRLGASSRRCVARRVRLWTLRHRELGGEDCSMSGDAFRI